MTQANFPIRGPFKGVVSDMPSPGDNQAFDDIVNFLCRKGRIHTRPRLNAFASLPDGKPVLKGYTFRDQENNFHTLILTTDHAYFLTAGVVFNALGYSGVIGLAGTGLPFSIANPLNRVYLVNGSVKLVYADGSNAILAAGNVPGSGYFLAQNIQSLIMAPTIEPGPGETGSLLLPNRVRWSASGNPNQWDPGADFTAGFADLTDISDVITGLSTIGRNTYVHHRAGMVSMYPTGIGNDPFAFEPISISLDGIGLEADWQYTRDQYNGMEIYKGQSDIWKFDGNSHSPIGGMNKKQIFADLERATGTVVGRITPSLGKGFDFLSYWLSIPGPNVSWVYGIDDGSWQKFSSSLGYLTCLDLVSLE